MQDYRRLISLWFLSFWLVQTDILHRCWTAKFNFVECFSIQASTKHRWRFLSAQQITFGLMHMHSLSIPLQADGHCICCYFPISAVFVFPHIPILFSLCWNYTWTTSPAKFRVGFLNAFRTSPAKFRVGFLNAFRSFVYKRACFSTWLL